MLSRYFGKQGNKKYPTRTVVLVGAFIFLVAGWFWWQGIYNSPARVFWGMFDNNLSTNSVTWHINQSSNNQMVTQDIRLQLGAQNVTHSLVTIAQGSNNDSVVKSESIGTLDNDYSRYLTIKSPQKNASGQPIDFSKIEGLWSKTPDANPPQPASANYFRQAALGIMPFANLPRQARQEIINLIRDSQIYKTDYSQVKKVKQNGRTVYVYPVTIAPQNYVAMLQKFGLILGLGKISELDPATYAGSPSIQIDFYVDKLSRQLVKLHYTGTGAEETFSGYGLFTPTVLPQSTIPLSDLQNRIQSLL